MLTKEKAEALEALSKDLLEQMAHLPKGEQMLVISEMLAEMAVRERNSAGFISDITRCSAIIAVMKKLEGDRT